ncbi:alpha-amylase family glycosyl hydrolase [Corallincola platygyrae]|uniref:Alpha-amylase family glycosyl hydrolase n=1 Tax=Corallincola platygyrae TaxID=1193278 RepID=A0ABW4XQB9_9GAMM
MDAKLTVGLLLAASVLSACGGGSSGGTPGGTETKTEPEVTYTPYPCDQTLYQQTDRLRIYHVMTEAFIDGDTNRGYGIGYGPSHHNGDIQGITDSLDYIQSLGMNAIWLTPVFESVQDAGQPDNVTRLDATGYFGSNYFAIDPNFGSLEQARTLVDEAHARGLYVFFDGVFGHHKTNAPEYASPNGLTLSGQGPHYADSLTTTQLSTFPVDLDFMKEVATYWIRELKIDGWRLDVANEVPVGGWGEIRQLVEETSQSVTYQMNGETVNPLGYMVAEIFDGSGDKVRSHGYGTAELPGVCSALDFAMRYQLVQTLAAEESGRGAPYPSQLNLGWQLNSANPDYAHPNLFVTNHDLVRLGDLIQRAGLEEEYFERHRAVYSFVAAYSGPITLYYGDEIGDEVPGFAETNDVCNGIDVMCDDHVARTSGKIEGLPLDETRTPFTASTEQAALRDYIRQLMLMRDAHPALYSGERVPLLAENATGLYADLKVADSEQILYLLNADSTAHEATFEASQLANATSLTNLLTGQTVTVSGSVTLPIAAVTGEFWLVNN